MSDAADNIERVPLLRRILPGSGPWLLLSAAIVALDQWTKRWASAELVYGRPRVINEYLDFTLLHNTGAAFSFLANAGGWQRYFFITLSATVGVLLSVWLTRLPARGRLLLAIGLFGVHLLAEWTDCPQRRFGLKQRPRKTLGPPAGLIVELDAQIFGNRERGIVDTLQVRSTHCTLVLFGTAGHHRYSLCTAHTGFPWRSISIVNVANADSIVPSNYGERVALPTNPV